MTTHFSLPLLVDSDCLRERVVVMVFVVSLMSAMFADVVKVVVRSEEQKG